MKKARVNSRINNVKGKTSNSFKTKIQGVGRVKKESAVGYCTFHSTYVDEKRIEIKHCDTCERFIKLVKNIKKSEKKY